MTNFETARTVLLKNSLGQDPSSEAYNDKCKVNLGLHLVDCPTQLICTWIFICPYEFLGDELLTILFDMIVYTGYSGCVCFDKA